MTAKTKMVASDDDRILMWTLALLPLAFIITSGLPFIIRLIMYSWNKSAASKNPYLPLSNDEQDDEIEEEAPLLGSSSNASGAAAASDEETGSAVPSAEGEVSSSSTEESASTEPKIDEAAVKRTIAAAKEVFPGIKTDEVDTAAGVDAKDIRKSFHRDAQFRWLTVFLTALTLAASAYHTYTVATAQDSNDNNLTAEDTMIAGANTLSWFLAWILTLVNASMVSSTLSKIVSSNGNPKVAWASRMQVPSYSNAVLFFNFMMLTTSTILTAKLYDHLAGTETPEGANALWDLKSPFLHSLVVLVLTLIVIAVDIYRRGLRIDPNVLRKGKFRTTQEENASIYSKLTFSWLNPLIMHGNKRPLTADDLWKLRDLDTTQNVRDRFEKLISRNPAKPNRNATLYLTWALCTVVWAPLTLQFISAFFSTVLGLGAPYFLNAILKWTKSHQAGASYAEGWALLLAMFLCTVFKAVFDGQQYFHGRRVGLQMRAILIAEIYGKSLRRAAGVVASTPAAAAAKSDEEEKGKKVDEEEGEKKEDSAEKKEEEKKEESNEGETTLGKIVTLMSVDVGRVVDYMCYVHNLFLGTPLSIVLTFVFLYQILGWSSLVGLATILASGPLNTYLGSWINTVQDELMTATDNRVDATNEMLNGIRIIKYFGWENRFIDKVVKLRAKELYNGVRIMIFYSLSGIVSRAASILCFFVTFASYTLVAGHTLDAATAFTTVILLERLSEMMAYLPHDVMWALQAKVSLDRIGGFLKEPELEIYEAAKKGATHGSFEGGKTQTSYGTLRSTGSAATLSGNADDDDNDDVETLFTGDEPVVGFRNAKFAYYTSNKDDAAEKSSNEASKEPSKDKQPLKRSPSTNTLTDSSASQQFNLRNLSTSFRLGGLNVITGATGSGKSSLILALLGELKKIQGKVYFPARTTERLEGGSVAYVAQTAWLLNATIRDNILMGSPLEADRYKRVLEACALVKDLEILGGDLIEVGEKGISLSGGQKQRISLARALYSKAGTILLDDPLSAVDAPTARHLLTNAIQTAMKGRTVLLVTHAISLAARVADYIIVMKNGEILAQGTPAEVASNPLATEITTALVAEEASIGYETQSINSEDDATKKKLSEENEKEGVMSDDKDAKKLVEDEKMESGRVKFEVYKTYYYAAGGLAFLLLFMSGFVLENVISFLRDWWMKVWTDSHPSEDDIDAFSAASTQTTDMFGFLYVASTAAIDGLVKFTKDYSKPLFTFKSATMDSILINTLKVDNEEERAETVHFIVVYGLLSALKIVNDIVSNGLYVIINYKASYALHERLLRSVVNSPMRFFEVTPIGRILNRFSKDIASIDDQVLQAFSSMSHFIIKAGTIIVVVSSVSPIFIVGVIPLAFIYSYITKIYLNASRELKRLDSVTRSPIYSQFSETLSGVTTIRAFGQERRFAMQSADKTDMNHRCFYFLWGSNRWLNLRTDVISATVIFVSGVGVVMGDLSPGWAGIVLLYSGQFSECLLWVIRSVAEVEIGMNAVERVGEYCKLDQEPPAIVESYRPSPSWPEQGVVHVKNLSARYAEDQPLVLKSLNFKTNAGEKIGVVGRTGAGKSTLSLAFFRIIPFAEGTIEIDGMDISKMGLHDLRSKLTIIPQDPVLFTGSLRSNLDPFDECDDAELWRVLKSTHVLETMKTQKEESDETSAPTSSSSSTFTSLEAAPEEDTTLTLESPIAENGSNMSTGQRQLLCMARALLRKSKVIFLDEATASIDAATDARIQQTIREELNGATIFCIAHRLRTIVDYDRVLVLGAGEVIEFGTPLELLENSETNHFRRMCEETGEFDELLQIAREKAFKTSRLSVTTSSTATLF
ncbi:hypothetical protein HDV05_006664 [Chytridiales sp. JEL 0842]|nr:hypothetical protein HDV05_006664 [Chytridiales sp. JEL 0842]